LRARFRLMMSAMIPKASHETDGRAKTPRTRG